MGQAKTSRKAGSPGKIGDEDYWASARLLFERYATAKDPKVREQLIFMHSGLVERAARGFATSGEPTDDLIQEGYLGLIKAVDSFDLARDVKFVTYATHSIAGQIRHYLRDRRSLIREPGWLHELGQRLKRAQDQLAHQLNRAPTIEELAQDTNLTEDAVMEVLRTRGVFQVSSLDTPAEGSGAPEEAPLPLDRRKIRSARPVTGQLPVEDKIVLHEAIQKLKSLERKVIHLLFYRDLSQTEIASRLGISCNYVSHLVRSALRRLRQSLATDELRESHLRLRCALEDQERFLEALQRATPFDEVTNLLNGRAFRERLEEEVLRAARYGHQVAVVFLDLDRLTAFNREHGFAQGDELLAQVGQVVRRNVRKVDIVGRYGGGTFGVILPHTGGRAVTVVTPRLMAQVADTGFVLREGGALHVTVAAGVAVYPEHGISQEELMSGGLCAMREAKGLTENRFRAADARTVSASSG